MTDRLEVIETGPGLGRGLVWHDEASKAYRAITLTDATVPRTRGWRRGQAYDQGETFQCVAYTGKGVLNTRALSGKTPYKVRSRLDPGTLYAAAQDQDEWPGRDYDGTSGLGLCKALAGAGLITEYRWCFGLREVLITLSWVGPVGIGVRWREGMWSPDRDGYIHATGAVAGGHEVELTAIDVRRECVTITNSWGTDWGSHGRADLSWDDLGVLLADQGDAFVLVA